MTNNDQTVLLWEAFEEQNEKCFVHLLDMGANPEEALDKESELTTFELLCAKDSADFFLEKCIEYGADPNRMNHYNFQYPIHIAVKNLKLSNIKILLKANAECANQTFKCYRTPLHLLAELLNDFNVNLVFEIIQLLTDYGADFSWPAYRQDGETPFFVFLSKLVQLKNKTPGLDMLRYLYQKYPNINQFQKDQCATLMQEHFAEVTMIPSVDWMVDDSEYRKTMVHTKLKGSFWFKELVELLKQNEPLFLLEFQKAKVANRKLVEEALIDRTFATEADHLLDLAIEHDRFHSFVEIFGIVSETVDLEYVVQETLHYERHRILKYLVNHPKVKNISDSWLLTVLRKINWKQNADNCCHKCFYILLNHPNFSIDHNPSNDSGQATLRYELNCAAAVSDDAAVAMLKRGACLGQRDTDNRMMIEYLNDEFLLKYLDSCITTRKPRNMSDNDFYLVMDYSFLESSREMAAIEHISKEPNLQPLIVHPVIASFLFLRWFQLALVFYLNLLLFSINAVSSILFLVLFYVHPDHETRENMSWMSYTVLKYTTILSYVIFVLKEMGQFWSSRKAYLKSVENYFEIGLLCLMGVALFTPIGNDQYRRIVTAIFIMGTAFEWTLMFSALPMFTVTNYIVILKKVADSFFRMLAFYSVILLAFALSFHTLMCTSTSSSANNATSPNMQSTIFKTILMMTGDFGIDSENEQNVLVFRIFMVIFTLSITIVLMNLLLGLTISDTAAIEKHAELHNWLERTKLLAKYETMVWNSYHFFQHFGLDQKLLAMVQLIPNFLPMKKIKIEIISQVNATGIYIPKLGSADLFKADSRTSPNERDSEVKKDKLTRSFFGFKRTTVKMDERIVKSALEILERRGKSELEMEQERQKRIYNTGLEQKLDLLLLRA